MMIFTLVYHTLTVGGVTTRQPHGKESLKLQQQKNIKPIPQTIVNIITTFTVIIITYALQGTSLQQQLMANIVHTMQGNTCPTEWYISNGHSAKLQRCICCHWTMYPKINFQLSTNQNLFNACANSRDDPLDMYPSPWHSIALHSV